MVRRLLVVILLSGAILSAGCGVVEEKKNAALREVGRAALNSVMRIASQGGSSSSASQPAAAPVLVADSASQPARMEKARVAESNPSAEMEIVVESPRVAPAAREQLFTFTFNSESIDTAPLARGVAIAKAQERREQFLIEAKKLKRENAHIHEALRAATVGVTAAGPVSMELPDKLARIEVHLAERLDVEELRKAVSIPLPAQPSAPPAGGCSSQARTAS